MQQPQVDRDSWIRLKLDALDVVEREIEAVRPRNQVRENVLVLFLLSVTIGTGVAVSIDPSVLSISMFGLTTLSALAAWAVIIAPRHKLKALAWQRDQLLDQIGEASADHKT